MKNLIIICLLVTTAFTTQAQEKKVEDCGCPPPQKTDYQQICFEINEKQASGDETELSFKYQETLWRMSCAKDGVDDLETARKKIQCMWLKYRKLFSCNYPGVKVPKGNVTKYSLETGFSSFLIDAVKDYKLDMNFTDPVDGKTIMDFIVDEIEYFKRSPTDLTPKINEYERLYKLLKDNGAKHAKDL
jgi:hypothetical protein